MTLRRRLFLLFTPPLLLALLLIYLLGHGLILARLDREDEQLLHDEASQVRALINSLLERDHQRLLHLVRTLEPAMLADGGLALSPVTLDRVNFDFLMRIDAQGDVSATQWRASMLTDNLAMAEEPAADQQALREALLQMARQLRQAPDPLRKPRQLVVVRDVPLLLVVAAIDPSQGRAGGLLLGGHFIDSERMAYLQGQLHGVVHFVPAQAGVGNTEGLIDISPREVVDNRHQRIYLMFDNALGQPALRLELQRERHLYSEGRRQIGLFLGASTLIVGLAWLLIYLGLDRLLLRRIGSLQRELRQIGPDSAGRRLSDRGRDELGLLGQEANRMLDRLEQSEARDRAILAAIHEGYFELDSEGRLHGLNAAFCTLLGHPPQALEGRLFSELLDEPAARQMGSLLAESPGSEIPVFATSLRRGDGSLGYFETRFSRVQGNQGQVTGHRGILHDVSSHIEYQRQLFDMAYRDALTGLGNRKAFHEQLRGCLVPDHGVVALLFIDLDRFKQVNDRFGHDVGDELLVQVAGRMRDAVRKPDRAYRLGGDEFTLILPGTAAEDALRLAERLRESMGVPWQLGALVIDFVTPSIGIAVYPQHASDPDALIKAADQAMYEAKRQRNRVCLCSDEL